LPFQPAQQGRDGEHLSDELGPASKRPYAYLPITAGAVSFMYHLDVGGHRITDLKLSSATISKIFTGEITNWDDPAIHGDDGRYNLPSLPIKPIVRSDGSGTSWQLSNYLATLFPARWNQFCSTNTGHASPCPPTSFYPYSPGSTAQSGSDGVANAVAATYNNGAITYVEYGYATERAFPVIRLENAAGHFVLPTAPHIAAALTAATLNSDGTAQLSGVYTNTDPAAYPLSFYSYLIAPVTTVAPFTQAKGKTLGKFVVYAVCTGQQKAVRLGYAPLPSNLVQEAFDTESRIPGAPAPPPLDFTHCPNPTL
jgi:ABC-type phosphate transport system substrate-binding protein